MKINTSAAIAIRRVTTVMTGREPRLVAQPEQTDPGCWRTASRTRSAPTRRRWPPPRPGQRPRSLIVRDDEVVDRRLVLFELRPPDRPGGLAQVAHPADAGVQGDQQTDDADARADWPPRCRSVAVIGRRARRGATRRPGFQFVQQLLVVASTMPPTAKPTIRIGTRDRNEKYVIAPANWLPSRSPYRVMAAIRCLTLGLDAIRLPQQHRASHRRWVAYGGSPGPARRVRSRGSLGSTTGTSLGRTPRACSEFGR